ncbi:hypothetical protein GJ744_007538 [Endocarpon pusillum]|uniref:Uncharacterized protein n=1 Tax=Endocarpon pusillum TaxID=364733 RepID=A0A8H7E539_9EURO|nr:hypothetical protein GJ744_007538 [Endocarpon pusillum]
MNLATNLLAQFEHLTKSLTNPSRSCQHSESDAQLAPLPPVFRCVDFRANYSDNCWKKVEPHKNPELEHKQSDPGLADLLKGILEPPPRSVEQQGTLRKEDARTLWVGVSEKDEKQFIHEGDAGAGKSALIKLLIDVGLWSADSFPGFVYQKSAFPLRQNPVQKRSTPVVGCEDDE